MNQLTAVLYCIFDKPWEGNFSGYCTIIEDKGKFKLYYRGEERPWVMERKMK